LNCVVVVWLICVWYAEEKFSDKAKDWMSEDSVVMGWLSHSMKLQFATTVEFVIVLKRFGNLLQKLFCIRVMFSRVYEIYEKIFTIGLSGRPLSMIFFFQIQFCPLSLSLRGRY
jgi:hypothetical protein